MTAAVLNKSPVSPPAPTQKESQSDNDVFPGAFVVLPAGHAWHVADEVAPVAEKYLPAGHSVHETLAITLEYLPAGHAWHTFTEVAPVAEKYLPVGHAWHVLIKVAPVAEEYLPGAHFVQADRATAEPAAYDPASQDSHASS